MFTWIGGIVGTIAALAGAAFIRLWGEAHALNPSQGFWEWRVLQSDINGAAPLFVLAVIAMAFGTVAAVGSILAERGRHR